MSIANWFQDFNSNIQVQNTRSISDRYQRITQRLNADFWDTTSFTAHSLYVGSYGRNTAINGFSDLDLVFCLPSYLYTRHNNYNGNGQSALLQKVRASIQKTYSSTNLGADGQVLVIRFKDGLVFEIVPAFKNENQSFTYPDTNDGGEWRTTDPRPEIEAIRKCNRNVANGNLSRLCRMMRAWKSKWNVPIGGLLIDTLAYNFISSWRHRDKSFFYYDFMCREFFAYLAEQNTDQLYWYAPGSSRYVWRTGAFEYKAKRCYNISLTAIENENNGYKYTAKTNWREIFGTRFPG